MLILLDNTRLPALDADTFQLIHRYPVFSLLNFAGTNSTLDGIPHTTLEDCAIMVNGHPVAIAHGEFVEGTEPRTLLRFAGPIAREWQHTLARAKIRVLFWCPPFGACVEAPAGFDFAALAHTLPSLIGSLPYQEQHCRRTVTDVSDTVGRKAGVARDWADLVCFSREDRYRLTHEFGADGVEVIAHSDYKLRIVHPASLESVRRRRGVKLVNRARPALAASGQGLLEAMGMPGPPPAFLATDLDGSGQLVAVADTGFDRGDIETDVHPDFRGRVRWIHSWPINPSWNGYVNAPGHDDGAADVHSGHGTHVAGLAVGDGSASQGRYRGVAPGAGLVFQALEQYTRIQSAHENEIPTGYYLNGRPLDLRELFAQARADGARIHVNAWGDPTRGEYTDDCFEADDFLYKNDDALILFAAGNDGSDRNGDRRVDHGSLYAPACAKNVIAIGATEGPRRGVGWRTDWEAFNQSGSRRFAHQSDRHDPIAGHPEHIALISSAGPTRDGRIKPDLCAPGTNLAAARSQAADVRGWGLASPMPYYMYYGGTSMATGAAGGYFALLRQAWQLAHRGIAPSGAALKALAILAAAPVTQRDNDTIVEPRHIAGFGRLDLRRALPDPSNHIRLIDHREPGLSSGESLEFVIRLNEPMPLRAVLCWYDPPGEHLLNDLDLLLLHNDEVLHRGNHAAGQTGAPDRLNNVECIDTAALPPGEYVLCVEAFNVPRPPQTFALAMRVPPDSARDIPLTHVRGIGEVYAMRLQTAFIDDLDQLLTLDHSTLATTLGRSENQVRTLYIRLLLLKERLNWVPPHTLDPELTLADLRKERPRTVPVTVWQNLTQRLLPLTEVFDRSALAQIELARLFPLQA